MAEAKQRREERRQGLKKSNQTLNRKSVDSLRLKGEQKRHALKVLLDSLYDPDSSISKLLGIRTEVMGEIIWQKLAENWQIFPETPKRQKSTKKRQKLKKRK